MVEGGGSVEEERRCLEVQIYTSQDGTQRLLSPLTEVREIARCGGWQERCGRGAMKEGKKNCDGLNGTRAVGGRIQCRSVSETGVWVKMLREERTQLSKLNRLRSTRSKRLMSEIAE